MHVRTHFSYLARQFPGAVVRETRELLVVDSGLNCDTFNAVVDARLPEEDAAVVAQAAIKSFEGRAFSWWLGPGDLPGDLPDILGFLGLVRAEEEAAMELVFRRSDRRHLEPADPTPLRIVGASTEAIVRHYAQVVAANWTPPDEDVLTFFRSTWEAAADSTGPVRLFVGYFDGEPVAAAELTVSPDGSAGVYGVATLAEMRGRGFGTAMLHHTLAAAREWGASRVELQASKQGEPVYRKLGFRTTGAWAEYKPAP